MTRRQAARALRDTLRELLAATTGAHTSASHAADLALGFRPGLVPAASLVREASALLLHAAQDLQRLASVPPPPRPTRRRSRRTP